MKRDPITDKVEVCIPAEALTAVFDECDKYDVDETGGRLVGTYAGDSDDRLEIRITGIIPPGPKARRSATSLFQDGEFQAKVFREIEAEHPEVEHLGSWHTHHVNGYPTLSSGDRETYNRTVNHRKHNPPFFYALLVVNRRYAEEPLDRYGVRHFMVRRGDKTVYEIPREAVRITDEKLWWTKGKSGKRRKKADAYTGQPVIGVADRGIDQRFLKEFFPKLRPFLSGESKTVYWKGPIELIDGTEIVALIAEIGNGGNYAVRLKGARGELAEVIEESGGMQFGSGRAAAFGIQSMLNRKLYQAALEGEEHPYFLF